MSNIGSSLDHTLKTRAQNLHSNSSALEKQQKELEKETEGLRKQTDKLKKVADDGARRVKELGNVQNWAEMLERDFLVLGETMRLVRKADRGSGWDGNEEGWETSSGSESWSESEDEDGDDRDGDRVMKDGGDVPGGEQQKGVDAGKRADKENDTVKLAVELQTAVDGEGDTAMDEVDDHKGEYISKGKEVEGHEAQVAEGSSTNATTGSGYGSTSAADPSSSSAHTTASATS